MTPTLPAIPALTHNATADEILHAIFSLGIIAASIFVKNPASQKFAGSIINLTNQLVLPIADELLGQSQQQSTPPAP